MNSDNTYKKIFSTIFHQNPVDDISFRVLEHIRSYRRRKARIYSFIYSVTSLGAFTAFIFVIKSFISVIKQSGFTEYISLALTDSSVLMTSWKSFGMTILESAPLTESIAIVGLLFICILSLRNMSRSIGQVTSFRNIIH